MQDLNDDHVLTQLCTAAVNLSLGTDKVQEAYYIYQEMIDKNGSTPLLCNGIAATMFCSGRIPDAESFVQQALDIDSDQAETVINFMFLAHQQGTFLNVTIKSITISLHFLTLTITQEKNRSLSIDI